MGMPSTHSFNVHALIDDWLNDRFIEPIYFNSNRFVFSNQYIVALTSALAEMLRESELQATKLASEAFGALHHR
ncbi:hypothetical protein SAMN03084138_00823 [Enterovibrio norvegicus DSM 15893]|uniref:Uncharacterized protein n=1 Tax=Enterovibrio norvegicus DSM 15893 TaxID=1121869 RepID=A0A1I5KZM8_9GAMM|nr:hypothetical protein SAMN03084138_00823 [Enterovibrio norvegicus DSM 15893]